MDENGHLGVYGGDYMQMALCTLVNSVCSYLECQVSGNPDIHPKQMHIDDVFQYKLEQAADLIKKHLLRSVREEMEAMKGKLSTLETKIYRLEIENMHLLREYVPAEILKQRRLEDTDTKEISQPSENNNRVIKSSEGDHPKWYGQELPINGATKTGFSLESAAHLTTQAAPSC